MSVPISVTNPITFLATGGGYVQYVYVTDFGFSGALTFAYTEGTLAVSGSAMNATLQFTFTGSVNDVTVAGTGTTTFACKNGS